MVMGWLRTRLLFLVALGLCDLPFFFAEVFDEAPFRCPISLDDIPITAIAFYTTRVGALNSWQ